MWSSLERYTRPIDEDDIVDITTGEVIKDRGVIRASKKLPFGGFAGATGEDEEGYDEDGDDGESMDELDAFANEGVDDIHVNVGIRKVPPVREMDPEDAKDLREFREAERKRRETCGSEPDESEEEDAGGSEPDEGDEEDVNDATPHRPTTQSTGLEYESEDELLSNWKMDEASMVYLVPPKTLPKPDRPPDSTAISPPRTSSPLPSPLQSPSLRKVPPVRRIGPEYANDLKESAASPHLDLAKVLQGKVRPPKSKSKAELRGSGVRPPPVPAPTAPPHSNRPPSGHHQYPPSYPPSPPPPHLYYHPRQQQPPPPLYPPAPDPRTQCIITQAMHLAALIGGAWPPPPTPTEQRGAAPFTPPPDPYSRYRPYHPDGQPSDITYSTPTPHPQTPTHPYPHPHPHHYPYMYDPRASTALPELPMSTGAGSGADTSGSNSSSSSGRKSLVRRSRSRGRKVTFTVEEEREETGADDYDAEEAEGGLDRKTRRSLVRCQTPAPPSRTRSQKKGSY